MNTENYLTGMPTDVMSHYGLAKVLLTRRESIRLKHLQKTLFVYKKYTEEELMSKLNMLQFRSLFSYIEFLTNQLRGIYKFPRDYTVADVDDIVKERNISFPKMITLYKNANPLVVMDFDKTLTNPKCHILYRWLKLMGVSIVINSANPDIEYITRYFEKHDLPKPNKVYSNKGKKAKLVMLKTIAVKNYKRPKFYIDDEVEYLSYGILLFYQCFQYTKQGKLVRQTENVK